MVKAMTPNNTLDSTQIAELVKDRLLYECETMRAKINYEIEAAERQLASVTKRLVSLKHDLYIYLAFIFVPLVVLGLLAGLIALSGILLEPFLQTFFSLLLILFIMGLPFNIYHIIKTCLLIHVNKEAPEKMGCLPPEEGTYKDGKIPIEPNYQTEYQKLIAVLTKYYLHPEKLEQLEKQIHEKNCILTMYELKLEFMKMTFYEDIRPTDIFSSTMVKKARAITGIIFIILIIIIIGVIIL